MVLVEGSGGSLLLGSSEVGAEALDLHLVILCILHERPSSNLGDISEGVGVSTCPEGLEDSKHGVG